MAFVNRVQELAALEAWWQAPGGRLGLVWGRRRVGKTALISRFATSRRSVFHTGAGRPTADELGLLSREVAALDRGNGLRDLGERPFADWGDALEHLAALARDEPLLLVLDELPELVKVTPELPGIVRAFWDRARTRSQLRILLCGSALSTMQAMQEERSPLYGRIDLPLLVHPFRPHEAAEMLKGMKPADQALVWGIAGGMPLYLEWWDAGATVRENLLSLVARPGGQLLNEGALVLATEADAGPLAPQALRAIAAGRTKHNEIQTAIGSEPARTLDRLVELRLVERLVPVTEDPSHTRRRLYRIADNFLAFWLGVVEPHRGEIERGLGTSIVRVVESSLDDHMGARWEEAFRIHLRRLADAGELGEDVVAVGPFWRDRPPVEIDAVALAGRGREAVLAGEAKWAKSVDGARILRGLEEKAAAIPKQREPLRFAIAAREEVKQPGDALVVTARDVMGGG